MKRILTLVVVLAAFSVIILLPDVSYAVPSFARQVQKPCSACHTMWPNLNQAGRQFKVKAYTDVSPEWNIVKKDRLNMLAVLPVSVRVFAYPYFSEKKDGEKTDFSDIPHEVELFLAGRISENFGLFSEIEWEPNEDVDAALGPIILSFQHPVGEGDTLGLVLFRGPAVAADPFNSFGGRQRSLIYGGSTRRALTFKRGEAFAPANDNQALVANGYFLGNRLYAAIGAMRGEDTQADDPIDGYFRAAWDQQIPNGAVTFGAAAYVGKQNDSLVEYDTNRYFLDASLEYAVGDHLIESQVMYSTGDDDDGSTKFDIDGLYLEASYFFQRQMGVTASYNTVDYDKSDDTVDETTWTVGALYSPWQNIKIGIQYEDKEEEFDVAATTKEEVIRTFVDIAF